MVIVDNVKNIQRIIDRIKADTPLFDSGATEGKVREVIFGDPDNNQKIAIKQKPAIYVTTKDSIQNSRYNFGYVTADNQAQVSVEYEIVIVASSKVRTANSQKQLYDILKNLREMIIGDPRFSDPASPGTDFVFSRSIVNGVKWDSGSKGKLITSVSVTLLATIGAAFTANFPGIGDVILLSKPNAPEGIVFSDDREQKPTPNRVITENGDFGALNVEYESTVVLDDAFRAKFGVEEDVTITTASGAHVYHIQYIDINPTASFDAIERTVLHMEIIPN